MHNQFELDGAKIIFTPPPLPLIGWALPHFLDLDEARPGFLARMVRAGSRRRQTVYACLAPGALERPQAFAPLLGDGMGWHGAIWPALLAEALLEAHPRDLLRTAFGSLPDGLLPLLGRGGADPLPRALYGRLHALYSDPSQRRRQRLLSEAPRLTEGRVAAVEALPACTLHPRVFRIARSREEALEIAAAVESALAFSSATPASIWKSISDLAEDSGRSKWITNLLEGFDRPARKPCLDALPDARLLDTGAKLKKAGRDMRNCLGRSAHCLEVMHGRAAYVLIGEPQVVVVMRAVGDGWCTTRFYAEANGIVDEEQRLAISQRFADAGFPPLGGGPDGGALDRLRNATQGFWLDDLDEI